jgi:hypothetical protein
MPAKAGIQVSRSKIFWIPAFQTVSQLAKLPIFVFLSFRLRKAYFFIIHNIIEMIMLMIIIVVMGKNIFTLGLLIIISPGSRPMGTLPSHGHKTPIRISIAPMMIKDFCIAVNMIDLQMVTHHFFQSLLQSLQFLSDQR